MTRNGNGRQIYMYIKVAISRTYSVCKATRVLLIFRAQELNVVIPRADRSLKKDQPLYRCTERERERERERASESEREDGEREREVSSL